MEAHLCATGATDGAVRLWDLRRVDGDAETSEWELSDVLEETEEDGACIGTGTGESVVVERPRTTPNGTRSRSRTSKEEDASGPCIRVLEGHSKAVTALYFENDTLVRPHSIFLEMRKGASLHITTGDRRIRQDATPMGPRDRAMRDDDGHPLGDFASAVRRAGWAPARIFRRGHVCGADAAVCGRKLGALPGLYRGGAVVGVRAGERERGWCGANVGHADGSSPSDASRAHGPCDQSPI